MISPFKLPSLLIALSLSLSGCFSLPKDFNSLKEPKVSLAGLTIKDLNPFKPRFLVRLAVENPNDLAVNLDGGEVALALNGEPVAAGISRSALTLEKFGTSKMDVEVVADTLGVLQQILRLQSKPTVDYAVTGHLNVLNWLGPLGKLPFSFEGAVDRDTLLRGAESLGNLAAPPAARSGAAK
jgi:LEA14-like dessication related protein